MEKNMRERALSLAEKIVSVRRELISLESEFDALFPNSDDIGHRRESNDDGVPDFSVCRNSRSSDIVSGSIPDQILKTVNSKPNYVFTTEEFFVVGTKQSVRSALHRMCEKGQLLRVGRGRYRATVGESVDGG